MSSVRRSGRLVAWLAIFAVLLAALAPGVARALPSSQKAMPWTDICTVAGVQTAHDAAPASGSGHGDATAFKHCPCCLNHAGNFAPPTASLDCMPVMDVGSEVLPLSVTAPSPRFILTAAQPRAPPAIS